MFNINIVDSNTGGAYKFKPPHVNSNILIHQDSSVIDEENDYLNIFFTQLIKSKFLV